MAKRPYQSLGYSLAGFTAFQSNSFPLASSLWHFQTYLHMAEALALSAAVTVCTVPRLIGPGTNTTGITACAGMDFPQPTKVDRDYSRLTGTSSLVSWLTTYLLWTLVVGRRGVCPTITQLATKYVAFQVTQAL